MDAVKSLPAISFTLNSLVMGLCICIEKAAKIIIAKSQVVCGNFFFLIKSSLHH